MLLKLFTSKLIRAMIFIYW